MPALDIQPNALLSMFEVFNPNNDNGQNAGTDCRTQQRVDNGVQPPFAQFPSCYDGTAGSTTIENGTATTTYVKDINVKSLQYSPAQGLNLMLGLRYTFGSKPKPDPEVVIEEAVIEEEVIETPVRGLW